MDIHISVAGSSSLANTLVHIVFLLVSLAWLLVPLTMYLRFRRLIRQGDQSSPAWQEYVKAARRKIVGKLAPLVVAGVAGVAVAIMMLFFDAQFQEVDLGQQGVALDFGDFAQEDVFLKWSDITDIELHKRRPRNKWYLVIHTVDGDKYRSSYSPTYKENDEVLAAFKILHKYWRQANSSQSTSTNSK